MWVPNPIILTKEVMEDRTDTNNLRSIRIEVHPNGKWPFIVYDDDTNKEMPEVQSITLGLSLDDTCIEANCILIDFNNPITEYSEICIVKSINTKV